MKTILFQFYFTMCDGLNEQKELCNNKRNQWGRRWSCSGNEWAWSTCGRVWRWNCWSTPSSGAGSYCTGDTWRWTGRPASIRRDMATRRL